MNAVLQLESVTRIHGAGPTEVVAYIAGVVILSFLAVGARVLLMHTSGRTGQRSCLI